MKVYEPNFVKIAEGLKGSEGPVFGKDGHFYAVAPMEDADSQRDENTFRDGIGGKVYRVDLQNGEIECFCTPHFDGYGGRPAGCQFDKEGKLWVADMRHGLLKIDEQGNATQVAKVDTNGNILNSANDLVFDNNGNLWFTGPGNHIAPSKEVREVLFKTPVGKFYCLPYKQTEPIMVDDNFIFCNGVAVKDDLLIVAETMRQQLIAYDITGAGKIENRRIWAWGKLPDAGTFMPDGMDFDIAGQLLVANHGGSHIEVYSPNGGTMPVARIKCPFRQPSNLHFKPGTNLCFVTEHDNDALWKFEWEHCGMPMYCDL